MPSRSITLHSRRTLRTMTCVLEALMEMTTSLNFCFTHTRRNSMQLSTMPSGVSP